MPEGDVLQARIISKFCGEPIVYSFGFSVTVGGPGTTQEEMQRLADDVTTVLGLNSSAGLLLNGLNVQFACQSLQVIDVIPGTAGMLSLGLNGVGSVTDDDAMPPNDAMCVTWRSAFRGPGSRGRTYLTGFSEGSANGGFWEAGAQTYADTLASAFISNWGETGSGNYRFCILHKSSNGGVKHAPILPLIPPEIKPVMDLQVHNEVRSIGRRAVGRRIRRVRAAP